MITEAKKEVPVQEKISENLKKESDRLKKCLDDILKQHAEIIKNLPDFKTLSENEEEKAFLEPKAEDIKGETNKVDIKIEDNSKKKEKDLEFGPKYGTSSQYGEIFGKK